VIREQLQLALREAVEAGEHRAAATLRLILTALNERDLSAGHAGDEPGLEEGEIVSMLEDMVRQRQEEIARCEQCALLDRAEQESEEIRIIRRFLPAKMTQAQVADAVEDAIRHTGAKKLKDCGRVIAALKERYNGQMDFARAKRLLCERLH
jgi:uncharacterized protein YqeY